jgi:CRISPR/Cas system-associated endonuclease Cas3-HD
MNSGQYKFGKFLVKLFLSSSVDKVVSNVLKNNMVDESLLGAFRTKVGIMVISGAVVEHSMRIVNENITIVENYMTSAQMRQKQEEEEERRKEEEAKGNIVEGVVVSEEPIP